MEGIKNGIIVDGAIHVPVSAEHEKGNLCLQCSLKKCCDKHYTFDRVCVHFEKVLGETIFFKKAYQEMANLRCETAIKASFSKAKTVNNRFKRYFESLKKLIKN